MCSSETKGSPKASSFKQNSTIGRGRAAPSSSPKRLAKVPAAKFRTITSNGIISTARINCSRILILLIKWVGTPTVFNPVIKNSDKRLFKTPLPSITSFFFALNAVASSLKYCTRVLGSGPS